MTKIFASVLLTALIVILLLNFSTRILINKIKNGGAVKSGYACVEIVSGSMEPVILKNDLLIIKGYDVYNHGDIVTYMQEDGILITHRIKEVSENGYILQGDANNTPDEEITQQRIMGKTVIVLAGAGIIMQRIFFLPSILLIVGIIITIILIKATIDTDSKLKH